MIERVGAITYQIISRDMSVPQNPVRHIQGAGIRVAKPPARLK
jgi:hypothetical protein